MLLMAGWLVGWWIDREWWGGGWVWGGVRGARPWGCLWVDWNGGGLGDGVAWCGGVRPVDRLIDGVGYRVLVIGD